MQAPTSDRSQVHQATFPPRVAFFGAECSAFQVCGYSGFLVAAVQSALLVRRFHLSQWVLLGMIAVTVFTFFGIAMAGKIVTGEEKITYYRHEIAILAMLALFLFMLREPILAYLDIAILGIGSFLVCGRIGCLMVGCCHGRPCGWGVRYSEQHVADGFPSYLAGMRLFPIQAVESVFVLGVVMCGIALRLRGSPSGTALALYTLVYGIGRFGFEFARSDRDRAYLWGFSEAQWTSLFLTTALVAAERAWAFPGYRWHWLIPASMAASMGALAIWRQLDRAGKHELWHPHHLWEVLSALDHLDGSQDLVIPPSTSPYPAMLHVAETSRGYRLSLGESISQECSIRHYSVSKAGRSLSLSAAQGLARLISQRERDSDPCTIVSGGAGVFHFLFGARARPH
jgi:hypothetical protein